MYKDDPFKGIAHCTPKGTIFECSLTYNVYMLYYSIYIRLFLAVTTIRSELYLLIPHLTLPWESNPCPRPECIYQQRFHNLGNQISLWNLEWTI